MYCHLVLAAQLRFYFYGPLLFLLSLFIILLVLIQRGKGGGLSGAFGGAGGQSAFGARATEQITWVTAGTVALWILVCASAVVFLKSEGRFSSSETTTEGSALISPDTADGDENGSPGSE